MGGALALLIVSFFPEDMMNAFQMNLTGVVLTGAFSTGAKLLNESGLVAKLMKTGLVALLIGSTGCAVQLGTVVPEIHTGADGETIVACEVKGVTLAFGDGGICRNIEGGHVSQAFAGLFTSTIGLAMSAVAGIFGGIGAIGSGMAAQPIPQPVAAAPHPPAIIEESAPNPFIEETPADWFN